MYWKIHINKKRKEVGTKHKYNVLVARKKNKQFLYRQILKPYGRMRTYGAVPVKVAFKLFNAFRIKY